MTPFALPFQKSLVAVSLGMAAAVAMAQPLLPPQALGGALAKPLETVQGLLPALDNSLEAVLKDRYIVVLDARQPQVLERVQALLPSLGGVVHHRYETAFKGLVLTLPKPVVQALQNNPLVLSVEPNQEIRLRQDGTTTQANAPWGLDRVDQRTLPLDRSYVYFRTGRGVNAYVVDSGIYAAHTEVAGRVAEGVTFVGDGRGASDCNGHGSHVAGILGAQTFGVAKQVNLVPVRVFGCDGSSSSSVIAAAVDWLAANHQKPAVVNMSLGGGASAAIDTAVANLIARGVPVVVAAGNESGNACNYSPARVPAALTVAATTNSDARASYSNFGSCVDLYAPGSSILSMGYQFPTQTAMLSGTSMAAPHVAGAVALAQQANPTASPAALARFIKSNATPVGALGSPLLFAAASGVPSESAQTVGGVMAMSGTRVNRLLGGWAARVRIQVNAFDGSNWGAAVPNLTVSGTFTPGGAASCVTNATGWCEVTSPYGNNSVKQRSFTVNGVAGEDFSYQPKINAVTSIVVR